MVSFGPIMWIPSGFLGKFNDKFNQPGYKGATPVVVPVEQKKTYQEL